MIHKLGFQAGYEAGYEDGYEGVRRGITDDRSVFDYPAAERGNYLFAQKEGYEKGLTDGAMTSLREKLNEAI